MEAAGHGRHQDRGAQARRFRAQDSPRAADKILTEIGRKCKMLARLPRLGRRREELAPGLRSFAVGSYVVFYRAMRGGVEIIRVLYGARDIVSELE